MEQYAPCLLYSLICATFNFKGYVDAILPNLVLLPAVSALIR